MTSVPAAISGGRRLCVKLRKSFSSCWHRPRPWAFRRSTCCLTVSSHIRQLSSEHVATLCTWFVCSRTCPRSDTVTRASGSHFPSCIGGAESAGAEPRFSPLSLFSSVWTNMANRCRPRSYSFGTGTVPVTGWLYCPLTPTWLRKRLSAYGKRWDIETFFKVSKSYLRLAKELQGRTYDQMFAHTTIVFARYIMLAIASRDAQDPRTIGALSFDCCDELDDIRFVDALRLLLELLRTALEATLAQRNDVIEQVMQQFIDRLPSVQSRRN